jgi:signal transduction histidine kinase
MKGFVLIDEAEVKTTDLHGSIEDSLSLLQNQLRAGSIEIVREFDETIPQILCRAAEINQVIMHLLQTAIDAIEGSVSITTTLTLICVN